MSISLDLTVVVFVFCFLSTNLPPIFRNVCIYAALRGGGRLVVDGRYFAFLEVLRFTKYSEPYFATRFWRSGMPESMRPKAEAGCLMFLLLIVFYGRN
jgi:hypothetical protein